ncbi:putative metabolite transporter [Macrolepiota fuliginosa MF-IS2]|uniref:Metabolite transporter n=1 Tax=Macrolepiota fuliginosa MF-IS2 TaxID=1400762 RepID=A0A9P5XBW4_9AGAR|nr:putative metabolite transporter [Macrolepiota fuliginosa MF-IS2]
MRTFKDRLKGVSLIFACGTALFSDGYSNGVINNVNTLLTRIYGSDRIEANNYGTTVRSLAFAGTVVGMLLFGTYNLDLPVYICITKGETGWLSDKIGRKFGMMAASGIVVVFALLSSASAGAHGSLSGMLAMLSTMRFLLGIGIGAEYPCGSVSAAEQSEESNIYKYSQHRWVALATNHMINWGFVLAAFVPLVLFWIFGNDHLRAIWRLSLGLGAVPAMLVFIWRLSMEEPIRYKKDSMKRAKIPYRLVFKRYWASLSAVSAIWFLFDFIVYPFDIYSTTILNNITGGNDSLAVIFGWNVVLNLVKIPGAMGGAFFLDYLGPRWTLISALLVQAVVGFLMSALYKPYVVYISLTFRLQLYPHYVHSLTKHIAAFTVVYGIFQSLGAAGPGNCTILLAAKTSSTAVRGQYYGVAAAVGKIGAFVGTWVFPPLIDAFGGPTSLRGNTGPFWVGSGLSLASAIIAFIWVKPLTHDGLIEEDRAFRAYLEANGYDTSKMGLEDETVESVEVFEGPKDDPFSAEHEKL